jgi:hypothetical protein
MPRSPRHTSIASHPAAGDPPHNTLNIFKAAHSARGPNIAKNELKQIYDIDADMGIMKKLF